MKSRYDCLYSSLFLAIKDYPFLRLADLEYGGDKCVQLTLMCEQEFTNIEFCEKTYKELEATTKNKEKKEILNDLLLVCAILKGEKNLEELDVEKNFAIYKKVFDCYTFSNADIEEHFFTESLPEIRDKFVRNLERVM